MSLIQNQDTNFFDSTKKNISVNELNEENGSTILNEIEKNDEDILENCNFEDDEFGNFEEASTSHIPKELNENSENNEDVSNLSNKPSSSKNILLNFEKYSSSLLSVLFEDRNLWIMDEKFYNEDNHSDDNIVDNFGDIFLKFDLCDKKLENGMPKNLEESCIKLWSRLCFIEDTDALKFLWIKSTAFSTLLKSLHINNKRITCLRPTNPLLTNSQSDNSVSMDRALTNTSSLIASSSSSNNLSMSSTNTNVNKYDTPIKNRVSNTIDSLCVPPVNFDWQSSGLSNPLTGASMSAMAAVLECDFFNLDHTGGNFSNSLSILEHDLQALGLNLTSNMEHSNKIPIDILNDLLQKMPKECNDEMESKILSDPTSNKKVNLKKMYTPVDELPKEAKSIYEKIPDLSYMLNEHLVFPLNNS